MSREGDVRVEKPPALAKGSTIALVSPASPGDEIKVQDGMQELTRLGFNVIPPAARIPLGYFSGTHEERMMEFAKAMQNKEIQGLVAIRGGFGSGHMFDLKFNSRLPMPKCIVGFSDITAVQVLLWQVRRWVTFYGPMTGAGFAAGAGRPSGYDETSFLQAVQTTSGGWTLPLLGQTLVDGEAEGRLLGGCLTLLQTSIGTGWELDTRGAILVLEDRGMKPYQVDRVLLHLLQAGKFNEVRGIILGEFPECEAPNLGGPSVLDVCRDMLAPLGVPIVYGAPVGHTNRPMLTLPLGVKAKLDATREGKLEILEAAVQP
jgi:muramoyltetrapeptide carboxypeptidase